LSAAYVLLNVVPLIDQSSKIPPTSTQVLAEKRAAVRSASQPSSTIADLKLPVNQKFDAIVKDSMKSSPDDWIKEKEDKMNALLEKKRDQLLSDSSESTSAMKAQSVTIADGAAKATAATAEAFKAEVNKEDSKKEEGVKVEAKKEEPKKADVDVKKEDSKSKEMKSDVKKEEPKSELKKEEVKAESKKDEAAVKKEEVKPEVKKDDVKAEVKKEEPKKDEVKGEVKKEEPKKDEVKAEVKKEEPKKDEVKAEVKKEEPKKDEVKAEVKKEEPKKDEVKAEVKKEEPKKDEVKKELPKKEEAKAEIKTEEPKKEMTKAAAPTEDKMMDRLMTKMDEVKIKEPETFISPEKKIDEPALKDTQSEKKEDFVAPSSEKKEQPVAEKKASTDEQKVAPVSTPPSQTVSETAKAPVASVEVRKPAVEAAPDDSIGPIFQNAAKSMDAFFTGIGRTTSSITRQVTKLLPTDVAKEFEKVNDKDVGLFTSVAFLATTVGGFVIAATRDDEPDSKKLREEKPVNGENRALRNNGKSPSLSDLEIADSQAGVRRENTRAVSGSTRSGEADFNSIPKDRPGGSWPSVTSQAIDPRWMSVAPKEMQPDYSSQRKLADYLAGSVNDSTIVGSKNPTSDSTTKRNIYQSSPPNVSASNGTPQAKPADTRWTSVAPSEQQPNKSSQTERNSMMEDISAARRGKPKDDSLEKISAEPAFPEIEAFDEKLTGSAPSPWARIFREATAMRNGSKGKSFTSTGVTEYRSRQTVPKTTTLRDTRISTGGDQFRKDNTSSVLSSKKPEVISRGPYPSATNSVISLYWQAETPEKHGGSAGSEVWQIAKQPADVEDLSSRSQEPQTVERKMRETVGDSVRGFEKSQNMQESLAINMNARSGDAGVPQPIEETDRKADSGDFGAQLSQTIFEATDQNLPKTVDRPNESGASQTMQESPGMNGRSASSKVPQASEQELLKANGNSAFQAKQEFVALDGTSVSREIPLTDNTSPESTDGTQGATQTGQEALPPSAAPRAVDAILLPTSVNTGRRVPDKNTNWTDGEVEYSSTDAEKSKAEPSQLLESDNQATSSNPWPYVSGETFTAPPNFGSYVDMVAAAALADFSRKEKYSSSEMVDVIDPDDEFSSLNSSFQ
jgi:hypothetical protein